MLLFLSLHLTPSAHHPSPFLSQLASPASPSLTICPRFFVPSIFPFHSQPRCRVSTKTLRFLLSPYHPNPLMLLDFLQQIVLLQIPAPVVSCASIRNLGACSHPRINFRLHILQMHIGSQLNSS